MKKRFLFLLLLVFVLLCAACGARQTEPDEVSEQPNAADTDSDASPAPDEQWQTVTIGGVEMLWDGYRVQEPESNIDIDTMHFSDFGDDLFTEQYPVQVETYTLAAGEITEATVYHITAEQQGKTVYIVAGVHGDEIAAWYAGKLLRNATIRSGELYVLAPANANGARNVSRYVTDKQDLNRSFPGDANGNEAERFAAALFADISDKQPDLLLDLHEAIVYTEGRDFLGSTLIFTKLDGMEEMFFDLLFATQDGTICSNEFGYTGPGPEGSINASVTNELGIPSITVETFRGFPVERRVGDQLDVVQYVLQYLELR